MARSISDLKAQFDATSESDLSQLANLLEKLTTEYFKAKQFDEAKEANTKEILLRKKIGNNDAYAKVIHTKAVLAQLTWDFQEAERLYLECNDLLSTSSDLKQKDQSIYSLANLYQHYIGDFEKSFYFYNLGYKIALESEDELRQSFFLDHLAMAKYWLKDYYSAIKLHADSWSILRKHPQSINHLFHKIQLASIYIEQEEFERAMEELLSIVNLKKENTDVYSNVSFLISLAMISKQANDLILENESVMVEVVDIDLSAESLLEQARDIGLENEHIASIVQANLYLVEEVIVRNLNYAMNLLSEASKLAKGQNRTKELNLIQGICKKLNIDFRKIG